MLCSAVIIGSWNILRRGNFYTFCVIIIFNSPNIVIILNENFIDVHEISLTKTKNIMCCIVCFIIRMCTT